MFNRAHRPSIDLPPRGSPPGEPPRVVRRPLAAPSPMPFPHLPQIQEATGTTMPLASVRDDLGCAARSTPAFTEGSTTHFAGERPSLHVAAHEAAHQLQHAGVTRDAGLGPEGHASAVADGVYAGRSVAGLIGARGQPVPSALRNYVEEGAKYGDGARLGEIGETLTFRSKVAYATPALITSSNSALQTRKSGIAISPAGASMTVDVPGGGTKTLSQVDVKIEKSPEKRELSGDCRETAREVSGPKGDEEGFERVVCTPGRTKQEEELQPDENPQEIYVLVLYMEEKLAKERQRRKKAGEAPMTPEEERQIVEKARQEMHDMSLRAKIKERWRLLKRLTISDERGKELGIDTAVEPEVGESFAVQRGELARHGEDNFHYATVIMVAGPDRVTLENLNGKRGQRDQNWYMQTYGPAAKGQTFHQDWAHKIGKHAHTFRVRTQPPLPPGAEDIFQLPTATLLKRHRDTKNPNEQYYLEQELAGRFITVDVTVIKQQEWGQDNVKLRTGRVTTMPVDLAAGQSHRFTLSASQLLPAADPLRIDVIEHDPFLDDFIGSVAWPWPHESITRRVAGDGAVYDVKANM